MFKSLKYIIAILAFFAFQLNAFAQCSMCRAVAESNTNGGGSMAMGLNNGILYLMAIPYLLMALIAFLWYRNKKANNRAQV